MATIKSYTDMEQSKKLAEFMPLESADMCWFEGEPFVEAVTGYEEERAESHRQAGMEMYPCWSLAALLGVLWTFTSPTAFSVKVSVPSLIKTEDGYKLTYTGDVEVPIESVADNPVDACYEMILKLHELNLL